MGRLIDADKLLEETRRDRDYARKNGFLDMYYERQVLIDRIKAQPTAYDIDKVVEELEENASRYTKKYTTPYGNNGYRDTKAISIHKAIEIVKQGGVYDDVCEWKMDNVGASIGCRSDIHHTGYVNEIYCPFCKKKIKVVE